MRRTISVLGLLVLVLTMAPAANADPPVTEPWEPWAGTLEDCGFPILVEREGGMTWRTWERLAVFVHLNGGSVRTQLTNTATGETISRNTSGPEMDVYYPDGSARFTFPGPSLFWSTGIEGLPTVFITTGRFRVLVDPEGNLEVTRRGRVEDICEALAP